MMHRRTWIVAGALIGLALGAIAPRVIIGQSPPELTSYPIRNADRALLADAPYDVLEPGWLPDGFKLVSTSIMGPPDTTGGVFSVDELYMAANGRSIHIWQTNMTEFIGTEFDPLAVGSPTRLGEISWTSTDHAIGEQTRHVMTARLPGQITISADTDLEISALEQVVRSLK